ncbi:MAG: hypothetical protein KKI12_12305 [Proteobacteria bacterium]|nr:hypothetical protein [Pseudomonadota bacterium]MBU4288938.1 hypothetical protein [Pseudomonadota bacterium]MBU4415493.1 hypothetical protein [Pseudomonadota bacterium]MCG2758169.1 hypothetical protein [Desulfobacteraceae bacterium]
MFGIKKFLSMRQKSGDSNLEQAISIDDICRTVTGKSVNFKTILRAYYEVSDIIDNMEHTYLENRGFDISLIESNCKNISSNMYKIVENLNYLSDNRYEKLIDLLENLLANMNNELAKLSDTFDETVKTESENEGVDKTSSSSIILANLLKYNTRLNLNANSHNYTLKECQTIRDISCFAYEMSSREFFDCRKKEAFCPEKIAKRLVIDIPMQWWVVDLDGGFKKGVEGDVVRLEDIRSAPMLTLWEGITAVPWKSPPIDTKGFLSVVFSATMDRSLVPGMRPRYAVRNYFIISRSFCHLSSRFGFHFSTVEASFGQKSEDNYLCFSFNGGGADHVRKARRADLIKIILEKFDFWVEVKDDLVFAWLEGHKENYLEDRLKILGHLVMHTRQLDMVLSSNARVNWYVEETLKQISSFVNIP